MTTFLKYRVNDMGLINESIHLSTEEELLPAFTNLHIVYEV
jgi:hypothetical protein